MANTHPKDASYTEIRYQGKAQASETVPRPRSTKNRRTCGVLAPYGGVREFVNKSAASAASPGYIKFQAVIKSAASAASLGEAALAADWITPFFLIFGRAGGQKIFKIFDNGLKTRLRKTTFFILLRRPRALARPPRAQAQGL